MPIMGGFEACQKIRNRGSNNFMQFVSLKKSTQNLR